MDVDCYEVTHSGEGEPGEKVEVLNVRSPAEAAQEAASYFDDGEITREGDESVGHMDGSSQVIEVRWPGAPPRRFRVRCRVVRRYQAEDYAP